MTFILMCWLWGVVCVSTQLLRFGAGHLTPMILVVAVMLWPAWLLITIVGNLAEYAIENEEDASGE